MFGAGIFGEHLIKSESEPTIDQIENKVADLINSGEMKLKSDVGFHSKNKWTLTYEEVTEKKEKELILGTWV